MAGVQVGDILQLSRLAWSLYEAGFNEQLRASRQYTEFFNDVKSLASNLDSLNRIARNAAVQLQVRNPSRSQPLWDVNSLNEILGDYRQTIRECHKLLRDNNQYENASSPLRNVAFNILVQPDVERLRNRIIVHNSKMLFLLKPFEIDLLYRIHQDLASRMTDMHNDLRRLMGVMIPNFQDEMAHQNHQDTFTLPVPADLSLRFQRAAEIYHPELANGAEFPLAETSNAFVLHFNKSTRAFTAGRFDFVERKTVPPTAYVSLLKCVWLMQQLQNGSAIQASGPRSHWPSYVKGLDQELSQECWRFSPECPDRIFAPDFNAASLDPSMFNIWPEVQRSSNLPAAYHRTWMMREIITVPLSSSSPSVTMSLKLSQILNGSPAQYRLVETAEERLSNGSVIPEERITDINLDSTSLVPLYAMPGFDGGAQEVLLRTSSMGTKYSFFSSKDLLRFQQAFTGFKPYKFYSQRNVRVAFVVSNKSPVIEDAVVQLWGPKRLEGQLVNDAQTPAPESRPEIREELASTSPMDIPQRAATVPDLDQPSPVSPTNYFSTTNPFNLDSLSLSSPLSSSPQMGSSPGSQPSATHERTTSSSTGSSTYSPHRRGTLATTASRASQSTVTVLNMGDGTSGFLHERPLRPMLVVFSRSRSGNHQLSITSIKIDDDTGVNPERCQCRIAGSSCSTTAIERSAGRENLFAQRYVAENGVEDFDLGKLGLARRREFPDSAYKDLKRISISFPDSGARQFFSGFMCRCKIIRQADLNSCIQSGHQGIFGEVKETGRRELRAYHRAAQEHKDLVVGQGPPPVG